MNASAEARVLSMWDDFADDYSFYDDEGEQYYYDARKELRHSRLDALRASITAFRNGEETLAEFRGAIASEVKSNNYWGFSGFAQMFFNMLVNQSEEANKTQETTRLLRETLDPPATADQAADRIERLREYIEDLAAAADDTDNPPAPGYVPMFLSFLWHVQAVEDVPVYYQNSRTALQDLDIWTEEGPFEERYRQFWEVYDECRRLIEETRDEAVETWELEYALLRYANRDVIPEPDDESTLWLVAAGSTSDKLNRTVRNPVDLDTVQRHSDIDLDIDGDSIPIWGHTSGPGEGPDVSTGDILLLYRKGAYRYAGTVLAQEQNNSLGTAIWESGVPDEEFQQIYYLTDLRELNLPNEQFNAIVDYAPNYYQQGFTTPNDDAIGLLKEKFGGIQEFVDAVSGGDPPEQYRRIAEQLKTTGQVIFHGPPGTGKTFHAKEFAEWWINEYPGTRQLNQQLQFVTFHPSFTYEDFIEGLTASSEDGQITYDLKDGVFKRVCQNVRHWDGQEKTTAADMEHDPRYVLVLDEINRGNVASILGETVTLLEKDKRADGENALSVQLAHSHEEFEIPSNVYLIGTMNTADRSIALVDAAIRRRFGFVPFPPDYDALREEFEFASQDAVENALSRNGVEGLQALSLEALRVLNDRIRNRGDLGRGKQIGHSYLFGCHDETALVRAWKFEILPLLEEYFFGAFGELLATLFAVEHSEYLFDTEYEQIRSTFGSTAPADVTEASALRTVLREVVNGD